jgi:glutaredoxin-dependent peroxiredoxin
MSIQPGQKAPDFSLYDTSRTKVALSDFKGQNVLLLFFPMAFSSTCTKELCSVRDNIAMYQKANAIVFGISVDSVYSLARYKEEQNLNFSLLSDFNKEVSRAYGSIYEIWNMDMKGVSKRSAFVIDREGVVRYVEILENPGLVPDFSAIENILAEIK